MASRILIVDDNTANLYLLETLLKGYGFDVIQAENGRDALEKARLAPPDLIVADILMPVMDGYALCREWKSDDTLKHIPLVFYTATYTDPKDEAFATGLGADRFVLKPQEPDALIAIIQEVLAEHREAREPTKPLGEEMEFLRQHNETLFRKLEQKMSHLETANRELRVSEERYRLSFENVSDIICTIGADLVITDISPSIKRLMGLRPEDVIGRPVIFWEQFLTHEAFELLMNNIHRILEGEIIPSAIYEFILSDETTAYSDISGAPLVRDGEIVGLITVARDVTERRQAEEALHDAYRRLDEIIDFIPDATFAIDCDGKVITWNRSMEQVTGVPKEEMIGKGDHEYAVPLYGRRRRILADLIIRPDEAFEKDHYENIHRHGGIADAESSASSLHDGKGAFIWSIASPLFDTAGNLIGAIESIRDITERKQAEEILIKSEEKFRKIFYTSLDAMNINLLENGNYISINPGFTKIMGYTEKDIAKDISIKNKVWDNIEDRQRLIGGLRKDGEIIGLETAFRTKNGDLRYGLLSASVIDFDGVPHILSITRDITERKEAFEKLRRAIETTIQVIVSTVEARDPYTAGHQIRVAHLARAIAGEMDLPAEQIDGIFRAASIHDIGKLSIPAEILTKPTALTQTEYTLIKEHPEKGYEILKDVESDWPLAEIVRQHHERMDGSGYPHSLKGDEILIEARIIAVADVVEAMASHRPYRPSLGIEPALDEITKNRKIFYDPSVVDACLRLFRERGYRLA